MHVCSTKELIGDNQGWYHYTYNEYNTSLVPAFPSRDISAMRFLSKRLKTIISVWILNNIPEENSDIYVIRMFFQKRRGGNWADFILKCSVFLPLPFFTGCKFTPMWILTLKARAKQQWRDLPLCPFFVKEVCQKKKLL